MAKTARSKKAKGTRLEKDIARELRHSGVDKEAKRMPMSGAISGFKSDIFTKLPFIIECKNQERWSPEAYMEQANKDAKVQNKMPVVIMSKNRMPDPYVMMTFSDWIYVLQRAFIENDMPVTTGSKSFSKREQLK